MSNRRNLSFTALILALMLLSIFICSQVWAATVMPISRLAEVKNVAWAPINSQQKALAKVQHDLSPAKARLKLTVSGYEWGTIQEQNVTFHRFDVPGSGVTPTVGLPELPVFRRLVAVPEGARVTFSFKPGQTKTVGNVKVYPVQEPLPEAMQTQLPYSVVKKFTINNTFYARDQVYPSNIVTVSAPMKIREMTVVEVEIAAMQYNPAKKSLSVHSDVDVELAFSKPFAAKTVKSTPYARPMPSAVSAAGIARPSLKAYRALDKIVVDWDLVRDRIAHMKWDYLILTPDAFYNDVQPLANWKRTKGLSVQVTKLSELTLPTTVDKIRNYIQTAYNNHAVEYVLLVGDTNALPGFYYPNSAGTISDYHYTLVSGNDKLPDLALGRFSGRTSAEIASMVTKTVRYEQTPLAGSWKKRAVCISDTGYFQVTSDYNYSKLVANGFTVDKIYASLGNANVTNVSNAINNGRLLVSYRGHGHQTGWSTTGFGNANVNSLSNGNMLPVIISPTCLTGMYDYTSDSYSESWSKTGSSSVPKGAVAFWGSARISYGGYNDELSKGAFDDMLAGDHIMGNVVNAAKLHMLSIYGVADGTALLELYMFNLFGDPNLNINF